MGRPSSARSRSATWGSTAYARDPEGDVIGLWETASDWSGSAGSGPVDRFPGMAATGFHTVDELNALLPGTLPGLLGIVFTAHEPGRLEGRLDVRPEVLAPNGYLHAATVVGLADTACGLATRALLPEGSTGFTTIELKTNYLGTAREGRIGVVATNAHAGRTTQVWDAVVTAEATGRTIALFRCTQSVLWPK